MSAARPETGGSANSKALTFRPSACAINNRDSPCLDPLAGKPAPANILIDVGETRARVFRRGKPDTADPAQLVSFGTSGHRGTRCERHLHRSAHPRHHASDLRIPHGQRITGPLSWAKTRTRFRTSRSARRSRCWLRTTSIRHSTGQRIHSHAGHFARHPDLQSRPHKRACRTASSSPLRTIRRRMVASNTIRPMAAPPIPMSRAGFRIAPMNYCAAETAV